MKISATLFAAFLFLLQPSLLLAQPAPVTVGQINEESGLTLRECYQLALKRSETIAIQAELINQTEGQILESLSIAMPQVSYTYDTSWQDGRGNRNLRESRNGGGFQLTQPLFQGFREFAAVGASKHLGRQREAELRRAKELLFKDVSDAFFFVISYQDDEKTLENTRSALFERLGELKKRQVIGRSKRSEIASAEAALRRTEASLESVRAQKEVAEQLMEFLIGRPFNELIDTGDPLMVISLDDALARIEKRGDVVAARESAASFRKGITAEKSAFFPTVDLTGNSYTKRTDALEGNNWDVLLRVNVPIFNGLGDVGGVKQARALYNQSELRLTETRRRAKLQIENAYSLWQANSRRVAALDKAVTAAELNYRLQVQDYQNNLVSNLDVLQSLQDLHNVRRELVSAKADARRSYWSLKVAMGNINE